MPNYKGMTEKLQLERLPEKGAPPTFKQLTFRKGAGL